MQKHTVRKNYIPWYHVVLAFLSLAVYLYYLLIVIALLFGVFGISGGVERMILRAAGLMLIVPETITDIVGVVLIVGIILFQKFFKKNTPPPTKAEVEA